MNEITIKLSPDRINVLMMALGELPLKSVVDVWADIKGQAEAQIKAAEEKAAAEKTLLADTQKELALAQAKLKALEPKQPEEEKND